MEDSRCDEGVEESDDGIVDVPEGAHTDLADEDYGDWDERTEESSCPDGNDFVTHWVGKLRVDDLAILEIDGEGAGGCRVSFVDLGMKVRLRLGDGEALETYAKTDYTHNYHRDEIKPGNFEPLAEGWSS